MKEVKTFKCDSYITKSIREYRNGKVTKMFDITRHF